MPTTNETMAEVKVAWDEGREPDFHVDAHPHQIREGDRVVVTEGEHVGRHGRVVLTQDNENRLIVQLLDLDRGFARVVLDRDLTGGWSGILPLAILEPTRLETDDELHARIAEVYGRISHALESKGQALEDFARHLGLKRLEVTIFDTGGRPGGLHER